MKNLHDLYIFLTNGCYYKLIIKDKVTIRGYIMNSVEKTSYIEFLL